VNPLSLRFAIEPVGLQVEFEICPGECIRIGSSEEVEVTVPQQGLAGHHLSIERRQDGRIYLVFVVGVDPTLEGHEADNPIDLPTRFETCGLQFSLERIEGTESTLSLPQDSGDSDSVDFTHIPLNREARSSEKSGGSSAKRFVLAATALLIGVAIIGGWVISDRQPDSTSTSNSETGAALGSETEIVPAEDSPPPATVPAATVPAAKPPEPSTVLTGVLLLDSTPGGADVFVDGKKKGMTPEFAGLTLSLTLPEGEHEVLISKEGVGTAKRTIFIGSDVIQPLTLVIAPVEVPKVPDKVLPAPVVNAAPNTPGELIEFSLPGGNLIRFRYCPPGKFLMGVPPGPNDPADASKVVDVELTRGFWIAETECTEAQWGIIRGTTLEQQVALAGESIYWNAKGPRHPITYVNHGEASAFCQSLGNKLNLKQGWRCVLPSEAQWEYACRAGTTTDFHFGDTLSANSANFSLSGDRFPKATGKFSPNAWGIHDMHGNVSEWCSDRFRLQLKGGTDPTGPTTGVPRVVKGGSYGSPAWGCRSGSRFSNEPDVRNDGLGFRPALVLPDEAPWVNLTEAMPRKEIAKGEGFAELEQLNEGSIGETIEAKLTSDVSIQFCFCPPGDFMMGTSRGNDPSEAAVEVRISRDFWLARTECTQSQWEVIMGRTQRDQAKLAGGKLSGEDENQPVYFVSHLEAQEYCQRLAEVVKLPSGWSFALPSEAQWEYACRAGTQSLYHYGDILNVTNSNCDVPVRIGPPVTPRPGQFQVAEPHQFSLRRTAIAGSYQPNTWGLVDMHGNVSEWCSDWMPYFEAGLDLVARKVHARLPGGVDPEGASEGPWRIYRGGSWSSSGTYCTSYHRGFAEPGTRSNTMGFRIAIIRSKGD